MNPFKINDIVRTVAGNKSGGIVKYIACKGATIGGGKTCDKKNCNHYVKDYVWVKWQDNTLCSYENTELAMDVNEIAPTPIKVIEDKKPNVGYNISSNEKQEKHFDYMLYNGMTQVRYTRDGREVLVDVSGGAGLVIPPIEENELDFDAYNTKGLTKRKKS